MSVSPTLCSPPRMVEGRLPADARAPRKARLAIEGACRSWGVCEADVETVVLLVSEGVTNAQAAAEGQEITYRATLRSCCLVLDIWDPVPLAASVTEDSLGMPGLEAESGRGLPLIDLMSRRWCFLASSTGPGKHLIVRVPVEVRCVCGEESL